MKIIFGKEEKEQVLEGLCGSWKSEGQSDGIRGKLEG